MIAFPMLVTERLRLPFWPNQEIFLYSSFEIKRFAIERTMFLPSLPSIPVRWVCIQETTRTDHSLFDMGIPSTFINISTDEGMSLSRIEPMTLKRLLKIPKWKYFPGGTDLIPVTFRGVFNKVWVVFGRDNPHSKRRNILSKASTAFCLIPQVKAHRAKNFEI
jgi:hypothetical protein